MNKFQKFNNNLVHNIGNLFRPVNRTLEELFKALAAVVIGILSIALMLCGSIPIIYLIFIIVSKASHHPIEFDSVIFLKWIGIGILGWYLGRGIQENLRE